MGTWGAGIFDDDTSCDVRGLYRRARRAGVPGPKATDQILRAYARPLGGCDAGYLAPSRPRCRSSRHGAKTPPWNPDQHLLFRFTDGQQVLLGVLDVQEFLPEATEDTLPV